MKKLFFTFIALLIVFFSVWGIKLRMPINRPNNVQGEQQVAWYETRYTAPTAEEEWTLDPEIPVNYLPVAGEDEVYMVLDDSGNIVGYRHRTQQEDGSWLWTDIEDPNAEHYEKVDGLDHIYKVTDKDGTSSYQQYVRNEDGSYAYVPVNENGVPLDDGADATTIDTTHYVHKSGNVYGLYNDNGVLTGYRERVKDGENYVWKVTDPPQSSTSDLQEWSEAKKDNANQGDLSADSGDGTQNSGNNGVIVGGSGAESSQIDNGDGTYTKTETNVSTKTEDGYCITYKTTVTSVYDTNGTLISTQKDGPYEVSREKLNVSEDPSAASAADTIDAEVARVSGRDMHAEFVANGLNCQLPLWEPDQKQYFQAAVDTAFSSQYTVETSIELYQNICEKAEELEDPTISKNGLHHILEQCGATEDDLNAFDREFPDNVVLHSNSIIDTRKCTISAYGMTLKIDRDQLDLLETRNIDGQTYLCIPITNNFRVNDVEIKG